MKLDKNHEMVRQYADTALWSSTLLSEDGEHGERDGDPCDEHYCADDLTERSWAKMIAECERFVREFGGEEAIERAIEEDGHDWGQVGHDLWLTAAGHGAGFFDGDWPKHGEALTAAAKKCAGEFWGFFETGDQTIEVA